MHIPGASAAAAATASASKVAIGSPMIGPRTIFIKVSPLPISFAERRAILHALKKQTRIEVFKKMRHAPASFISVAETEEGARKLVAVSPLTYDILTTGPDAPLIPKPTVMPTLPQHIADKQVRDSPSTPMPNTATAPDENRRQFVVHMFPSPNYKHMHHIALSPFYGPWKTDIHRKQTIIDALSKNIPQNIRQAGLAEWDPTVLDMEEPEPMPNSFNERFRRRKEMESQPAVFRGLASFQKEVEAAKQRRLLGELPGDDWSSNKDEMQPTDEWLMSHEKPIFQGPKKKTKPATETSSTDAVLQHPPNHDFLEASVATDESVESTSNSDSQPTQEDQLEGALDDSLEALTPYEETGDAWNTHHSPAKAVESQSTLDNASLASKIFESHIQKKEVQDRLDKDADSEAELASKLAAAHDEMDEPDKTTS
ncbi:hypothetical protein BROUX41_001341 [Berkeleyomyces rouxiae]|uniref:uncharacterized protein n=1 Tax=Berkeleyomyces rouxiae TaxID=2035830 RepID=UPI003B7CB078